MGQALYRKYRPRSFSEVVGQSAIVETLAKAIKSGRLSHAYLFSGPRGVGKTSVARILAHEINNLTYSGEAAHLDIIEIDAASNRRIDEVRDIRDKIHMAPTSAKYKVYIIDEVHMLTKEAFNALLKTLEEPPAHIVFILATTEAHKLPATIISRTQRFTFRPINSQDIVGNLAVISEAEKIKIDRQALELLADHSDGSFRDALSLLDQSSSIKGKITAERLGQLLNLPQLELAEKLIGHVEQGELDQVLNSFDELRSTSVDGLKLAQSLIKQLRNNIVTQSAEKLAVVTQLLKDLLEITEAKQPLDKLEIILLEAAAKNTNSTLPDNELAESSQTNAVSRNLPMDEKHSKSRKNSAVKNDFSLRQWPEILTAIKNQAGPLYAALRMAKPEYDSGSLTLLFNFPFHLKKVEQSGNLKLLGDTIEQVSGANIMIACQLDESLKNQVKPKARSETSSAAEFKTISNIFGSAEMLES